MKLILSDNEEKKETKITSNHNPVSCWCGVTNEFDNNDSVFNKARIVSIRFGEKDSKSRECLMSQFFFSPDLSHKPMFAT